MSYTTQGNVRGGCGHNHKSLFTAWKCACKDQDTCRRQGGYSDRSVVRANGEPLSEEEYWALHDATDHL